MGPDHGLPQRTEVERRIRRLLDDPAAVMLTSSCTHSLEACARLLAVGPGDEVIVPAFTFPSTANAFLSVGATLRFADVDLATGNVDPESVARRVGPRTSAIVVTHYGGVAADVHSLVELCGASGADLVEDGAHALFGSLDGTPLGRFGTASALSFHRTKNVSSVEGGALVLNDPSLVGPAQILLDKGTNRADFESGRVDSYEWSGWGSGWRLADPLIPLLVASLAESPTSQARRRLVWDRYRTELVPWADDIGAALPTVPPGAVHPAHLFWTRLPDGSDRQDFVRHCAGAGVEVARHYGSLPASRFGSSIADPGDRCPNAEVLATHLVRIPLHHQLTDDDVTATIEAVCSWRPDRTRRS